MLDRQCGKYVRQGDVGVSATKRRNIRYRECLSMIVKTEITELLRTMKFYSRKLVKPQDLNPSGTLFGGTLLQWIDEEAAIYVGCQLNQPQIVTKFISEIDFVSTAKLGDVVEIGLETVGLGTTSITMRCIARNKYTKAKILTINKLVFVRVDDDGKPIPHGKNAQEELHEVEGIDE